MSEQVSWIDVQIGWKVGRIISVSEPYLAAKEMNRAKIIEGEQEQIVVANVCTDDPEYAVRKAREGRESIVTAEALAYFDRHSAT